MCGPRIFTGTFSFGPVTAPPDAAGVAGNGALTVAFGEHFRFESKLVVRQRTTTGGRFALSFLQSAVTEIDDTGGGNFDSTLRQKLADGVVGNPAFAQRSNVLFEREQT